MAMHLPSNKSRGRRAPMAEINVTPMVDVMLVLLIIFMVTAPLMNAAVPVNLPDSRAKALEQEQKPVQITVDAKGQIFVETRKVTEAELAAQLADIAAHPAPDGKTPQILLRADTSLDYGRVMRVMGELNRAGLNHVSLITDASKP